VARVTKFCPVDQAKEPCTITGAVDAANQSMAYTVTCNTCGHVYAPDADFDVRDGAGWAKRVRAAHGALTDANGTPYPDPGE
jgi:uncharacterized OB-fold protein